MKEKGKKEKKRKKQCKKHKYENKETQKHTHLWNEERCLTTNMTTMIQEKQNKNTKKTNTN